MIAGRDALAEVLLLGLIVFGSHLLAMPPGLQAQLPDSTPGSAEPPRPQIVADYDHELAPRVQAVRALGKFDVLIATHSPQIIHDRWDLAVELKGPSR